MTKKCIQCQKEFILVRGRTHKKYCSRECNIIGWNKSKDRFYHMWAGMKSRCFNKNNPKYKIYGNRGIFVCEKWLSFDGFKQDMQEKYNEAILKYKDEDFQIDRINNDDGYFLENCRFVDRKTNCCNKQKNHLLTYKGETHCLMEWSRILDISKYNLENRINHYKWTTVRAFETPVRQTYRYPSSKAGKKDL